MLSEKPYIKSENAILRKHDPKWFGQRISIFGFQWKYVESITNNILIQIWFSSHDSMILCPIIVKNMRGIPQTETIHKVPNVAAKLSFPLLFIIAFYLCHVICTGSWFLCSDTLSSVIVSCADIFKQYFGKF